MPDPRRDYLSVTLSANFRSTPPLIAWFNDHFARILDVSPDGSPFDPATGCVFHKELLPGRASGADVPVHVLTLHRAKVRINRMNEVRSSSTK